MKRLQQLLEQGKAEPLTASELGELADLYDAARTERLAADKVAAAHKADESAAEAMLIEQMRSQEVSACGGSKLVVRIGSPDMVPAVKDWAKLYEFIKQNDAFDLLERRPGKAACRARWDDGQDVPGVEQFPVYKLQRSEVK